MGAAHDDEAPETDRTPATHTTSHEASVSPGAVAGSTPGRVSTLLTRALLSTLPEDQGVDLPFGSLDLRRPDSFVTPEVFLQLWSRALQLDATGPRSLEVASQLGRGQFRGVEYMVRSSDALGPGLDCLVRYHRLLFGRDVLEHRVTDSFEALAVAPLAGQDTPAEHAVSEFLLAFFVSLGRSATGVEWSPSRVRFAHPASWPARHYEDYLRCGVEFDAPETDMTIDQTTLGLSTAEPDPELAETIRLWLERARSELPDGGLWTTRVRRWVTESIDAEEPNLPDIARRLGVSVRTLQNRLREEGSGFQDLLDETRFELARVYLASDALTLPAVAQLLSYRDASAFHRAFKRWSGVSPGEFRRRALATG